MLRFVLIGCFLMIAIAALAAAPRVAPLGTPASSSDATQRVAGPAAAAVACALQRPDGAGSVIRFSLIRGCRN